MIPICQSPPAASFPAIAYTPAGSAMARAEPALGSNSDAYPLHPGRPEPIARGARHKWVANGATRIDECAPRGRPALPCQPARITTSCCSRSADRAASLLTLAANHRGTRTPSFRLSPCRDIGLCSKRHAKRSQHRARATRVRQGSAISVGFWLIFPKCLISW